MGSDLSTADEWLEIAAFSTGSLEIPSVDLTGWTITQAKDGGETVIAALDGLMIGSGHYLVIANYSAANSRLANDPALVTTGMSLPNTKLLLRLRNASGAVVDEVDDGVGAPFAGANPSGGIKASMERISPLVAGSLKENWMTATDSKGIDEGTAILGTPGFPNSSLLQVSSSSSASSTSSFTESSESSEAINLHSALHKAKINELLSSPTEGKEEWIEVVNTSTGSLDISLLSLHIGSSKFLFKNIVQSGAMLQAGEHRVFPFSITGLRLPNAGGTVRLMQDTALIDEMTYGELPVGVSIGRFSGTGTTFFCVPTPGFINAVQSPTINIIVQEGVLTGPDPLTVNLNIESLTGSIAGGRCSWDFGDGYTTDSCNPPSHKMRMTGDRSIRVQVQDYCGNTIEQSVQVSVVEKTAKRIITEKFLGNDRCVQQTFTGITITEFLPNPAGEEMEGEWIELKNEWDRPTSLCGWFIDDEGGGSPAYSLDRYALGPLSYLLIPRTQSKIALNNDNDSVRLIAPLPEGGTGVLVSIPYSNAETDQAFALRSDGQWLWTKYATPGADNQFEEVDVDVGATPVVISAAMPNPKGKDEGREWIEITNRTMYPQWMSGWNLEDQSGKYFDLQGIVLKRKETMRITLEDTHLTLGNAMGSVFLVDADGIKRSVLLWQKQKDDAIVRFFEGEKREVAALSLTETGALSVRFLLREVVEHIAASRKPHHEILTHSKRQIFNFGGIKIEEKIKSVNLISALMKDKKIDLENDSTEEDSAYLWIEGIDVQSLLLRLGHAYVTADYPFSRQLDYSVYEQEAREQKRGIWASEESTKMILAKREQERLQAIAKRDGLLLTADTDSGLVSSGSVIKFSTNLPANIYIADASRSFQQLASGSLMVQGNKKILVYAEMLSNSGSIAGIRSTVVKHEYIVEQPFYKPCILVSEVYPSPAKGEEEWVELYNKCDQEVSLVGWQLDDEEGGGSKPQSLSIDHVIGPRQYMIIGGDDLSITLNNDSDAVHVTTPKGTIQDSLFYQSLKKGQAIARMGELVCVTTTVTPGVGNICTPPKPKVKKAKAATKAVSALKIGLGTLFVAGGLRGEGEENLLGGSGGIGLYGGLNVKDSIKNVNNEKGEDSVGFVLILILVVMGVQVVGWVVYYSEKREK